MVVNAFPYPGNKAQYSEWIVSYLPEHTCYVEPFGGAGGVLLNKPPSDVEVYNDLDGDIVHFFRVLRERPDELVAWLNRVPFSRELHEEWSEAFYDGHRPDDDIERAGRWFYLRYSQFVGKYTSKSGFSVKCVSSGAGQLRKKTDQLDVIADRFLNVTIENNSYKEVLQQWDRPTTVFYIDPPYRGREYLYQGDGIDHRWIRDFATECDSKCIISYDEVPPFYGDGFVYVSRDVKARMNPQALNQQDAEEYLIMNFDAESEPLMSGVGQQTMDAF